MTIRHLLLGASASVALSLAAGAALAADPGDVCIDEGCTMISLFGIASDNDFAAAGDDGAGSTVAPHFGTWGFDTAGMDRSVKPGDDYNRFANGKAVDAIVIPSDRSRYGSFDILRELSDNRLRGLIDADVARSDLKPGSDDAKIAAAYKAYMDTQRIEALDAKPLAADLAGVRAMKTREDAARSMGSSFGGFGTSFFGLRVTPDDKDPDKYALNISQRGTGLPDRDYYLTPRFAAKRAAYQAYVGKMLGMVGWSDPDAAAKAVVDLETKIAEVQWTRIENRDSDKTYNPMSVADLETYAPGFPWRTFLDAAGARGATRVVLVQNTAVPQIAKIFAETPIETLQAWQTFHGVDESAPLLSKRFTDASFDFHGRTMQGTPEERAREKRAVSFTERTLGEALGRAYVNAYFPPESKATMVHLVGDLRAAMRVRIQNLPWMSPETKTKALEKLDKFGVKIGYPDHWRDYSALQLSADDLYGDARAAGKFEWNYRMNRLNKPVDRSEWGMTPQTVNAYYTPTGNEIVFPAAILQPPFFDPHADMAVNYGAIGGVIGHEMGHGFDDQGRKYDGTGKLTDWWTAQDAAKFQVEADKLGAQYDQFEILPGVHVQGKLTMGENIGDLNGSTLALAAYHKYLDGKPAPVLDGFTGDQRVYLGWAQVWREKAREDTYKNLVTTDPHSPGPFRAVGPLRNEDGWYAAWDIKPGDEEYIAPADRVRMW
ncbi:MAG TPA: M13-type metalloendopeptidase [Caulobacteraceae bacterium]|jgi:putative endopeptidase|nr:M13-type metalloendopeptidase [Caulobacteraceae bacterium]